MTTQDQTMGMDIFTVAKITLRRWMIVLPVLVLTGVGLWQLSERIEPEYEAVGSVLLQRAVGQEEGASSQARTVNNFIVAEILRSDEVVQDLEARGLPTQYSIQPQENGGIINIEASGTAPDGLSDTVAVLLERAEAELLQRQQADDLGTGSDAFVVLSEPTMAAAEYLTITTAESPALIHYVARGSAIISNFAVGSNPYGANAYTVRVLTAGMQDPGFIDALGLGEEVEFAVGAEGRDSAPIIALQVTGTSADETIAVYERLNSALSARLDELQDAAGVASTERLQLLGLVTPREAALLSTNLTRPLVTLAALGVLASVMLALAVDGIARRRSNQASHAGASGFVATNVPPPPAVKDAETTPTTNTERPESREASRQRLRRRRPRTDAAA
ncbi:hypothetical protein [Euzebya tangerina]|uniref:hypothetical protein n=1 Tax=Euzebya tangerina TaxID=591198 RepID=UPI000E31429D|nr:hypothetical protein [Euzebya tangerina]